MVNLRMRRFSAAALLIGGLAIFALTAILFVSLNEWLSQELNIEGAGAPYAYTALLCGFASGIASFYTAYLLFFRWDSARFLSTIQILLGLFSFCAVGSSLIFIAKTNLFGFEGAVGVLIALFVFIPLIFIAQLVKGDLISAD